MKKESQNTLLLLVAITTLLAIIAITFVISSPSKLTGGVTINPENSEDPLGIGMNPQDVIDNPESAANKSANYLKQQWNEIIAKTPVIGKIHAFFLANQMPFKFLFNMEYSFSLKFICVAILWLFIMTITADFLTWAKLSKFGFNLVIGLLFAIILARIGAINGIITSILTLISSQSLWWMRILLWFLVIAIICVIYYGFHEIGILIAGAKAGAESKEIAEHVEEFKKFKEGLKEGEKTSAPLKEIKKKLSKFE